MSSEKGVTMSKKLTYMEDLVGSEIASLANDEALLAKALERFSSAASNQVLSETFQYMAKESAHYAEQLAQGLSPKVPGSSRDSVKGIIEEGQKLLKNVGDPLLADVKLLAVAQRLMGFQVAAYQAALPLSRILNRSDLVLVCQAAVESKTRSVQDLQSVGLHHLYWRASWWNEEPNGTWERVKLALKEDWEKTKEHLGIHATDQEEHKDAPQPGPAFRYGYGAALHYRDLEWNEETISFLRSHYGGVWNERAGKQIERGWLYSREKHANVG